MPPRKAPKERGALPPSRKKKNTPHHGANTAGHPNPPVRDPSEEEAKEGSPSPSASLPSQQPTPDVGSKDGPTSLLAPSPSQHPTQEGGTKEGPTLLSASLPSQQPTQNEGPTSLCH